MERHQHQKEKKVSENKQNGTKDEINGKQSNGITSMVRIHIRNTLKLSNASNARHLFRLMQLSFLQKCIAHLEQNKKKKRKMPAFSSSGDHFLPFLLH